MQNKSDAAETPWPVELVVSAARDVLTVRYEGGRSHVLPAELMRVLTPSAERTGHGARSVIGGKRRVTIQSVSPVGRYAVRIGFSDGHNTGLYTLDALYEMGARQEMLWAEYLAELDATGLSRDKAGMAPAPVLKG